MLSKETSRKKATKVILVLVKMTQRSGTGAFQTPVNSAVVNFVVKAASILSAR